MKKIFITLFIGAMASTLLAQSFTGYDAHALTKTELNGTARFVGVGGAMGALGGDATTMHYNPAGIGIYHSSEVTASLNIHWNNATIGDCGESRRTTANLENIAYVGNWDIGASKGKSKGLIGLSFGVGYTRTKNLDRNGYYSRAKNYSKTQFLANDANTQNYAELNTYNFSNTNVGYRAIFGFETYAFSLDEDASTAADDYRYMSYYDYIGGGTVCDDVTFAERGSINEFTLSLAGNVSEIFYLGMSFVLDYTAYSRSEDYFERLADGSTISSYNNFNASGTGFTYKIGVIVRPTSWLRIGAAYHTPSYYRIRSSNYGTAASTLSQLSPTVLSKTHNVVGITNSESGSVTGAMKAMASVGFLIGKYGFIGIDYQWDNASAYKMKDSYGRSNNDMADNAKMSFIDTHSIRAGVEVKPIDDLSLRLGGGYSTSPTRDNAVRYYYRNDTRTDIQYINEKESYNVTAGIGYRIGRHSIDLAYVWQVTNGEYYEFCNPPTDGTATSDYILTPMEIRNVRNQIYLTYSVRF